MGRGREEKEERKGGRREGWEGVGEREEDLSSSQF